MHKKSLLSILQGGSFGLYGLGMGGALLTGSRFFLVPLALLSVPLIALHVLVFRDQKILHQYVQRVLNSILRNQDSILPRAKSLAPSSHNLDSLESIIAELAASYPKNDELSLLKQASQFVETMYETLRDILDQGAHQQKTLQERESELSALLESLQPLCSLHLPLEITERWKKIFTGRWDTVSMETLQSLSTIKDMEDSNTRFIRDVINQFSHQQNSYEIYTESYQESLKEYFNKINDIKIEYVQVLDASTNRVRSGLSQFQQIHDIVERIKLISLNISIEASKIKGSGAFSLLARELRRLAEHTEGTLKGIQQRTEEILKDIEINKEKQLRDFSSMVEHIEKFKEISTRYDSSTIELTSYINKAIHQIEKNQEQERDILMQFFKNLQNIAIHREELLHLLLYQKTFLQKTNEIVQVKVREHQLCRGTACPDRKAVLDLLASIITTDEERELLNALFKEYLGIQREETHGRLEESRDGVVLF